MADKRIDQLTAATTMGDDDLLVLQQNNQAKKLPGSVLSDYVYDVVEVSNTQPIESRNKVWIKPSSEDLVLAEQADVDELRTAIIQQNNLEGEFVYGSLLDTNGMYYDTNSLGYIVTKSKYSYEYGHLSLKLDTNDVVLYATAWQNGVYIGKLKTDGTFAKSSTDLKYLTELNFEDYPDYEFKFIVKKLDGSDVDLAEAENIDITFNDVKKLDISNNTDIQKTDKCSEAYLGDNLISVSSFSDIATNCTVTRNANAGTIILTIGSTADIYRSAQTPETYVQGALTVGKTYRFHAKAEKISGNPMLIMYVRGIEGNVAGLAASASLYSGEEYTIEFTVDEHMRRLGFFISFASTRKNCSAKFSDIWLKEVLSEATAVDYKCRDLSRSYPVSIPVTTINRAVYFVANSPFHNMTPTSQYNRVVMQPSIHIPKDHVYRFIASGFEKYAIIRSKNGDTTDTQIIWRNACSINLTVNGEKYVRFVFAKSDDSVISPDEVPIQVYDVTNVDITNRGFVIGIDSSPISNQIVASYSHSYVKNEDGVLKLSTNKGKIWNDGVDVSSVGLIRNYHLFANNSLAFFTDQKAYYIDDDWLQFAEATAYEADGVTPYTASTYDNFYQSRDTRYRKFVDGQELYVFGNYSTQTTGNPRRVLWFSKDNGHSYKVIYEFNKTGAYSARHTHYVIYNPNTDTFLCCTGDSSTESRVMELTYNESNETWGFTVLGSGLDYKWAGVDFYSNDIYYCYDNVPGSVMKCKYEDISDHSKHEVVLDNLPNDCIGLFIGERGDILVSLSWYRSSGTSNSTFTQEEDTRRLYYSEDREHFYNFIGNNERERAAAVYYGFYPVNDDGKILCGLTSESNWNRMPSVFLDDMVKRQGFPDAFKPYNRDFEIVPVLAIECDDASVSVGGTATISPKIYPFNATDKTYDIIGYDTSVISVSGSTITGVSAGTATATIRSKSNYETTKQITVTVT